MTRSTRNLNYQVLFESSDGLSEFAITQAGLYWVKSKSSTGRLLFDRVNSFSFARSSTPSSVFLWDPGTKEHHLVFNLKSSRQFQSHGQSLRWIENNCIFQWQPKEKKPLQTFSINDPTATLRVFYTANNDRVYSVFSADSDDGEVGSLYSFSPQDFSCKLLKTNFLGRSSNWSNSLVLGKNHVFVCDSGNQSHIYWFPLSGETSKSHPFTVQGPIRLWGETKDHSLLYSAPDKEGIDRLHLFEPGSRDAKVLFPEINFFSTDSVVVVDPHVYWISAKLSKTDQGTVFMGSLYEKSPPKELCSSQNDFTQLHFDSGYLYWIEALSMNKNQKDTRQLCRIAAAS